MMRILLALVLAGPLALFAQPHSDDAHHHDHDAPDLGNIGKAHLETSCSQAAQKEIDRGVTLIHSFWYAEAEKSFRRAAAADAECGMAWWGVAMSNLHPIWAPPTPDELKTGREAAEKATRAGAKTDREKAFIGAIATFYTESDKVDHKTRMLAYERAMAAVERDHRADREAAIFHALSLLGIAQPNDKSYARQKEAAEILNRVLPEEPRHPGIAHYLIHSFDYPELAQLALPAARVYAKLAPGSPHALHMPSHIFTRLGLWDESIASNLASAEKAHNYIAMRLPGAASFDELHAIDYLVYAYLQQGKMDEARKLVEKTAAITRIDNPAQFAAAYAIGAVPARYALERRQWKEAAALAVPTNVAWEKVPYAEGNIHFARGIGAARSGQIAIARDAVGRLTAIHQVLLDQKNAYWADQLEIQRLSVAAWLAHAERNDEEALKQMRAAVDLEASTEKHPVTPGPVIPARELLADMLLENGKRAEALAEVQRVIHDAPGRRNAMVLARQARTREQAGTP
jgi:tetratricopeptide (TPR) repeat protein